MSPPATTEFEMTAPPPHDGSPTDTSYVRYKLAVRQDGQINNITFLFDGISMRIFALGDIRLSFKLVFTAMFFVLFYTNFYNIIPIALTACVAFFVIYLLLNSNKIPNVSQTETEEVKHYRNADINTMCLNRNNNASSYSYKPTITGKLIHTQFYLGYYYKKSISMIKSSKPYRIRQKSCRAKTLRQRDIVLRRLVQGKDSWEMLLYDPMPQIDNVISCQNNNGLSDPPYNIGFQDKDILEIDHNVSFGIKKRRETRMKRDRPWKKPPAPVSDIWQKSGTSRALKNPVDRHTFNEVPVGIRADRMRTSANSHLYYAHHKPSTIVQGPNQAPMRQSVKSKHQHTNTFGRQTLPKEKPAEEVAAYPAVCDSDINNTTYNKQNGHTADIPKQSFRYSKNDDIDRTEKRKSVDTKDQVPSDHDKTETLIVDYSYEKHLVPLIDSDTEDNGTFENDAIPSLDHTTERTYADPSFKEFDVQNLKVNALPKSTADTSTKQLNHGSSSIWDHVATKKCLRNTCDTRKKKSRDKALVMPGLEKKIKAIVKSYMNFLASDIQQLTSDELETGGEHPSSEQCGASNSSVKQDYLKLSKESDISSACNKTVILDTIKNVDKYKHTFQTKVENAMFDRHCYNTANKITHGSKNVLSKSSRIPVPMKCEKYDGLRRNHQQSPLLQSCRKPPCPKRKQDVCPPANVYISQNDFSAFDLNPQKHVSISPAVTNGGKRGKYSKQSFQPQNIERRLAEKKNKAAARTSPQQKRKNVVKRFIPTKLGVSKLPQKTPDSKTSVLFDNKEDTLKGDRQCEVKPKQFHHTHLSGKPLGVPYARSRTDYTVVQCLENSNSPRRNVIELGEKIKHVSQGPHVLLTKNSVRNENVYFKSPYGNRACKTRNFKQENYQDDNDRIIKKLDRDNQLKTEHLDISQRVSESFTSPIISSLTNPSRHLETSPIEDTLAPTRSHHVTGPVNEADGKDNQRTSGSEDNTSTSSWHSTTSHYKDVFHALANSDIANAKLVNKNVAGYLDDSDSLNSIEDKCSISSVEDLQSSSFTLKSIPDLPYICPSAATMSPPSTVYASPTPDTDITSDQIKMTHAKNTNSESCLHTQKNNSLGRHDPELQTSFFTMCSLPSSATCDNLEYNQITTNKLDQCVAKSLYNNGEVQNEKFKTLQHQPLTTHIIEGLNISHNRTPKRLPLMRFLRKIKQSRKPTAEKYKGKLRTGIQLRRYHKSKRNRGYSSSESKNSCQSMSPPVFKRLLDFWENRSNASSKSNETNKKDEHVVIKKKTFDEIRVTDNPTTYRNENVLNHSTMPLATYTSSVQPCSNSTSFFSINQSESNVQDKTDDKKIDKTPITSNNVLSQRTPFPRRSRSGSVSMPALCVVTPTVRGSTTSVTRNTTLSNEDVENIHPIRAVRVDDLSFSSSQSVHQGGNTQANILEHNNGRGQATPVPVDLTRANTSSVDTVYFSDPSMSHLSTNTCRTQQLHCHLPRAKLRQIMRFLRSQTKETYSVGNSSNAVSDKHENIRGNRPRIGHTGVVPNLASRRKHGYFRQRFIQTKFTDTPLVRRSMDQNKTHQSPKLKVGTSPTNASSGNLDSSQNGQDTTATVDYAINHCGLARFEAALREMTKHKDPTSTQKPDRQHVISRQMKCGKQFPSYCKPIISPISNDGCSSDILKEDPRLQYREDRTHHKRMRNATEDKSDETITGNAETSTTISSCQITRSDTQTPSLTSAVNSLLDETESPPEMCYLLSTGLDCTSSSIDSSPTEFQINTEAALQMNQEMFNEESMMGNSAPHSSTVVGDNDAIKKVMHQRNAKMNFQNQIDKINVAKTQTALLASLKHNNTIHSLYKFRRNSKAGTASDSKHTNTSLVKSRERKAYRSHNPYLKHSHDHPTNINRSKFIMQNTTENDTIGSSIPRYFKRHGTQPMLQNTSYSIQNNVKSFKTTKITMPNDIYNFGLIDTNMDSDSNDTTIDTITSGSITVGESSSTPPRSTTTLNKICSRTFSVKKKSTFLKDIAVQCQVSRSLTKDGCCNENHRAMLDMASTFAEELSQKSTTIPQTSESRSLVKNLVPVPRGITGPQTDETTADSKVYCTRSIIDEDDCVAYRTTPEDKCDQCICDVYNTVRPESPSSRHRTRPHKQSATSDKREVSKRQAGGRTTWSKSVDSSPHCPLVHYGNAKKSLRLPEMDRFMEIYLRKSNVNSEAKTESSLNHHLESVFCDKSKEIYMSKDKTLPVPHTLSQSTYTGGSSECVCTRCCYTHTNTCTQCTHSGGTSCSTDTQCIQRMLKHYTTDTHCMHPNANTQCTQCSNIHLRTRTGCSKCNIAFTSNSLSRSQIFKSESLPSLHHPPKGNITGSLLNLRPGLKNYYTSSDTENSTKCTHSVLKSTNVLHTTVTSTDMTTSGSNTKTTNSKLSSTDMLTTSTITQFDKSQTTNQTTSMPSHSYVEVINTLLHGYHCKTKQASSKCENVRKSLPHFKTKNRKTNNTSASIKISKRNKYKKYLSLLQKEMSNLDHFEMTQLNMILSGVMGQDKSRNANCQQILKKNSKINSILRLIMNMRTHNITTKTYKDKNAYSLDSNSQHVSSKKKNISTDMNSTSRGKTDNSDNIGKPLINTEKEDVKSNKQSNLQRPNGKSVSGKQGSEVTIDVSRTQSFSSDIGDIEIVLGDDVPVSEVIDCIMTKLKHKNNNSSVAKQSSDTSTDLESKIMKVIQQMYGNTRIKREKERQQKRENIKESPVSNSEYSRYVRKRRSPRNHIHHSLNETPVRRQAKERHRIDISDEESKSRTPENPSKSSTLSAWLEVITPKSLRSKINKSDARHSANRQRCQDFRITQDLRERKVNHKRETKCVLNLGENHKDIRESDHHVVNKARQNDIVSLASEAMNPKSSTTLSGWIEAREGSNASQNTVQYKHNNRHLTKGKNYRHPCHSSPLLNILEKTKRGKVVKREVGHHRKIRQENIKTFTISKPLTHPTQKPSTAESNKLSKCKINRSKVKAHLSPKKEFKQRLEASISNTQIANIVSQISGRVTPSVTKCTGNRKDKSAQMCQHSSHLSNTSKQTDNSLETNQKPQSRANYNSYEDASHTENETEQVAKVIANILRKSKVHKSAKKDKCDEQLRAPNKNQEYQTIPKCFEQTNPPVLANNDVNGLEKGDIVKLIHETVKAQMDTIINSPIKTRKTVSDRRLAKMVWDKSENVTSSWSDFTTEVRVDKANTTCEKSTKPEINRDVVTPLMHENLDRVGAGCTETITETDTTSKEAITMRAPVTINTPENSVTFAMCTKSKGENDMKCVKLYLTNKEKDTSEIFVEPDSIHQDLSPTIKTKGGYIKVSYEKERGGVSIKESYKGSNKDDTKNINSMESVSSMNNVVKNNPTYFKDENICIKESINNRGGSRKSTLGIINDKTPQKDKNEEMLNENSNLGLHKECNRCDGLIMSEYRDGKSQANCSIQGRVSKQQPNHLVQTPRRDPRKQLRIFSQYNSKKMQCYNSSDSWPTTDESNTDTSENENTFWQPRKHLHLRKGNDFNSNDKCEAISESSEVHHNICNGMPHGNDPRLQTTKMYPNTNKERRQLEQGHSIDNFIQTSPKKGIAMYENHFQSNNHAKKRHKHNDKTLRHEKRYREMQRYPRNLKTPDMSQPIRDQESDHPLEERHGGPKSKVPLESMTRGSDRLTCIEHVRDEQSGSVQTQTETMNVNTRSDCQEEPVIENTDIQPHTTDKQNDTADNEPDNIVKQADTAHNILDSLKRLHSRLDSISNSEPQNNKKAPSQKQHDSLISVDSSDYTKKQRSSSPVMVQLEDGEQHNSRENMMFSPYEPGKKRIGSTHNYLNSGNAKYSEETLRSPRHHDILERIRDRQHSGIDGLFQPNHRTANVSSLKHEQFVKQDIERHSALNNSHAYRRGISRSKADIPVSPRSFSGDGYQFRLMNGHERNDHLKSYEKYSDRFGTSKRNVPRYNIDAGRFQGPASREITDSSPSSFLESHNNMRYSGIQQNSTRNRYQFTNPASRSATCDEIINGHVTQFLEPKVSSSTEPTGNFRTPVNITGQTTRMMQNCDTLENATNKQSAVHNQSQKLECTERSEQLRNMQPIQAPCPELTHPKAPQMSTASEFRQPPASQTHQGAVRNEDVPETLSKFQIQRINECVDPSRNPQSNTPQMQNQEANNKSGISLSPNSSKGILLSPQKSKERVRSPGRKVYFADSVHPPSAGQAEQSDRDEPPLGLRLQAPSTGSRMSVSQLQSSVGQHILGSPLDSRYPSSYSEQYVFNGITGRGFNNPQTGPLLRQKPTSIINKLQAQQQIRERYQQYKPPAVSPQPQLKPEELSDDWNSTVLDRLQKRSSEPNLVGNMPQGGTSLPIFKRNKWM